MRVVLMIYKLIKL